MSTTVRYDVIDSEDDGFSGQVYWGFYATQWLYLGAQLDSNQERWGIFTRFQNIQIPKGSEIISARIGIYHSTKTMSNGSPKCSVYFQDTGNVAAPPATWEEFQNLSLTSGISWDVESFAGGEVQYSPDIKEILQLIIDKEDYELGSSIMIIVRTNDSETGSNVTQLSSFEEGLPLFLEVEYSPVKVTTLQPSNITQSNFIANGSIDSIGEGITIVKRGFCYKVKE